MLPYSFRGLLNWMGVQLTHRQSPYCEISVSSKVIDVEPGAVQAMTLHGGSVDYSPEYTPDYAIERLVRQLIQRLLSHEMDEGIVVSGQLRWNPHPEEQRPPYLGKVVRTRELYPTVPELRRPAYFDTGTVKYLPPDYPPAGIRGLERCALSYPSRPLSPREYDEGRRGIRPRRAVADSHPDLFSFQGTLAVLCPRVYYRHNDMRSGPHIFDEENIDRDPCTVEVDILVPDPTLGSYLWQEVTMSCGCEETDPASDEFADAVRGCIHGLVKHVMSTCLVADEDRYSSPSPTASTRMMSPQPMPVVLAHASTVT